MGKTEKSTGQRYTFPYRSRCPKCGSLSTRRRHTGKRKQYRVCQECGHKYCVGGIEV